MVAEPCRDRLGRTLRQEVNRAMLFEIHQDGAIDSPLPEGKIIDAQDPGRSLGRRRGPAENPEDRITTERHAQAGGHPRTGFAARLAPEDTDGLRQAPGTLRVPGGERRQTFGKGLTWTRGGGTAKTPDMQAEGHRVLCDGKVPQAARVAAMDAC